MEFLDIFVKRNRKLVWKHIPDNCVVDDVRSGTTFKSETIVDREDYVVLRLTEMWLAVARKLWRSYYPMLHAYVEFGPRKVHDVVGPGQLREMGERNLDRLQTFNRRLAGPLPATGDELRALVGLYAVPGRDSAKALVDVVGSVAALAGAGGAAGAVIADVVKTSVDKVVGLADTTLQIGVDDTWGANRPLRSGYYVAIDADDVDRETLWLTPERRLKIGADPVQGKLYSDNDYMVLSVERQVHHPGWATIEAVRQAEAALEQIMASGLTDDERRRELTARWPAFESALRQARDLTPKDAMTIAAEVKRRLRERLDADQGFAAQARGIGPAALQRRTPFDAAEEALSRAESFTASARELESQLAATHFLKS